MSNSKLNSDEIKAAKQQLERRILDDVQLFEESTGTQVESILACEGWTLGHPTGKTDKIKVSAKL